MVSSTAWHQTLSVHAVATTTMMPSEVPGDRHDTFRDPWTWLNRYGRIFNIPNPDRLAGLPICCLRRITLDQAG